VWRIALVSGKTTFAKALESRLGRGFVFCPDEWNGCSFTKPLGTREKSAGGFETLPMESSVRSCSARGLMVIIEWGTWGRG